MQPQSLFDAHLHIIDPAFPLVANNGYLPEPFTHADYLTRMQPYRLCGGAVVSGSFRPSTRAICSPPCSAWGRPSSA